MASSALIGNQFIPTPAFISTSYQVAQQCPVRDSVGGLKEVGITEFAFTTGQLNTGEQKIIVSIQVNPAFTYLISVQGVSNGRRDGSNTDLTSMFDIVRMCSVKAGMALVTTPANSFVQDSPKLPLVDARGVLDCFTVYAYGSILGGNVVGRVSIIVSPVC